MTSSSQRDPRARGGRAWIDRSIRSIGLSLRRLNRDDFFELCQTAYTRTSLLHHQTLCARDGPDSVSRLLKGLARLAKYQHRFSRPIWALPDLRHLSRHEQWTELVRHLIEPYPLPVFLSHAWLASRVAQWGIKLHLSLANGLSLRRIALPDNTFCNKVVARYFMNAPDDATPLGAIRYAQVMAHAYQATREPPINLARFAMRWIGFSNDYDTNQFWNGLIHWMERERPAIDVMSEIYRALVTIRFSNASDEFGDGYPEQPIDSSIDVSNWSSRRVRRFLMHWRDDYRAKLAEEVATVPLPHRRWHKANIPDAEIDIGEERKIQIVQLCTPHELAVEGKRLSHCVASYANFCRRGRSSIFSLRIVRERAGRRVVRPRLTIEVRPSDKEVVTVLGKGNREPTDEELRWVNHWQQEWDRPT